MENEDLDISDKLLDNIEVENLINIKEEIEDLESELDNIIDICNTSINE